MVTKEYRAASPQKACRPSGTTTTSSRNWVKVVGSTTTQYLSAAGPTAASVAKLKEEDAMFSAGVQLGKSWRERSPPRPRPLSPIRSDDEMWWSSWAPVVAAEVAKVTAAVAAVAAAAVVSDGSEDETWGAWQAKSEPSECSECSVDWNDI